MVEGSREGERKMRYIGRVLMSFGMMVSSALMVILALKWEITSALFPITIGIPVFFMAMGAFYVSLFWKEEGGEKTSGADSKSFDIDPALEKRRTISVILWILGFFVLIFFVGFPIAVPLFTFLYLKICSRERWSISIGLAAFSWGFFFGLFKWLCHMPFIEGWFQKWLRSFGV